MGVKRYRLETFGINYGFRYDKEGTASGVYFEFSDKLVIRLVAGIDLLFMVFEEGTHDGKLELFVGVGVFAVPRHNVLGPSGRPEQCSTTPWVHA